MPEFVDGLLSELDLRTREHEVVPETIYLGGGTPSLLNKSQLSQLFDGLAEKIDLGRVVECTLEANPSTFDAKKAAHFKSIGINRASLGVQSWTSHVLRTLGRDHTPGEAALSYHQLREAGIQQVSIDLMFAIPGQTLEEWEKSLEHTVGLVPDHISAYNLNYEEDTPFFERLQDGIYTEDPEHDVPFFTTAIQHLENAGYSHYEISNYARPGAESRHNRSYWRGEDYLGLGPGAVSTVDGQRWTNLKNTPGYLSAITAGEDIKTEVETLGSEQFALERIALELRTREGLGLSYLTETQITKIQDLTEAGLAKPEAGRLSLTEKGKLLADSVSTYLVS